MYIDWTEEVRQRFLDHLKTTGSVSSAARLTPVSRQHAYTVRTFDTDFAAAWDAALIEAKRRLLIEARRRALESIDEPVVHGGAIVNGPDGRPLTIRRYNDRMLCYLLTRIQGELAQVRRSQDQRWRAARRAVTPAAIRAANGRVPANSWGGFDA
jgi:hypothetical protein